jgi:hypothetical protein
MMTYCMSTAILLSNRAKNKSTCILRATDISWCVAIIAV